MNRSSGPWAMLVAPLRAIARRTCPASGWELHRSCTATDGTVVCPSCAHTVPTRRDHRLGDQVRVVRGHHLT